MNYAEEGKAALRKLQAASPDPIGEAAIRNENMFAVLMEATKYCSLGQLIAAMLSSAKSRRCGRCGGTTLTATRSGFEVGGQYRRNM